MFDIDYLNLIIKFLNDEISNRLNRFEVLKSIYKQRGYNNCIDNLKTDLNRLSFEIDTLCNIISLINYYIDT